MQFLAFGWELNHPNPEGDSQTVDKYTTAETIRCFSLINIFVSDAIVRFEPAWQRYLASQS